MKNINSKNQAGFLNIIIIVAIAITFLAALGGGIYLMTKNKAVQKNQVDTATVEGQAPEAIQDVTVEDLSFDFKLSPMPSLNVSSVNLSAPAMPGGRMFPNFNVNSNFSYTGDTSIKTPSFTFDVPVPEELMNVPTAPPPPTIPTAPTAPTTPPAEPTGQSTDCAQFASVPSCSLVGAAGTAGYEACKTCFPSK